VGEGDDKRWVNVAGTETKQGRASIRRMEEKEKESDERLLMTALDERRALQVRVAFVPMTLLLFGRAFCGVVFVFICVLVWACGGVGVGGNEM